MSALRIKNIRESDPRSSEKKLLRFNCNCLSYFINYEDHFQYINNNSSMELVLSQTVSLITLQPVIIYVTKTHKKLVNSMIIFMRIDRI